VAGRGCLPICGAGCIAPPAIPAGSSRISISCCVNMSYQVLARKWRPRNFEQTVGQQSVLRALINALDTQTVCTTPSCSPARAASARPRSPASWPSASTASRGSVPSPAASAARCRGDGRRAVHRSDRSRCGFAHQGRGHARAARQRPVRAEPGRYKVYLIDEVHMLSGAPSTRC
jgi:DNA polymerase-3 subunit gamma/tau